MQLPQNTRAVSAKGTLDIELEDGRTATLEVDVDLSQDGTEFGVDHEYSEWTSGVTLSLGRCVATTHSLRIPTSLSREDGGATWTLRIPVGEGGEV